jgi:integrase
MTPRQRQQNGFVKATGSKPRTWTGYWYVYKEVDGKQKRYERSKVLGKRSEMNKGQAEDKLRAFLRTPDSPVDDGPPTFEFIADRYLKLKSGDWGVSQRVVIGSLFRNYVIPEIGTKKVTDLKPSDIKALFNVVAEKASQSYVKKCVTHVRAALEILVEDEVLPRNPAKAKIVTMPKTRKPSDRFLTLPECKRLLSLADGEDYIILRIFLSCALRPSEVFALRVQDVQPGKLMIDEAAIPCQGVVDTKTEGSEAPVPMSEALEAEIRGYMRDERLSDPRAFLFATRSGKPISYDNWLKRNLKKLAEKAGIEGTVNHQILRRTVATHMQDHGEVKSAQALLRHMDAETTLKHYQKTLDANVLAAHASWDKALTEKVQ